MAWSNSRIMAQMVESALNGTLAIDLDNDSVKAALYNNTITPDNTVDTETLASYNGTASQWLTANEVYDGTEWAQGGQALDGISAAKGAADAIYKFDATDETSAGTSATLTTYGCLVYDDTLATKIGLCYNYFSGEQTVTNGTFTIVWNASGIFTLTLT